MFVKFTLAIVSCIMTLWKRAEDRSITPWIKAWFIAAAEPFLQRECCAALVLTHDAVKRSAHVTQTMQAFATAFYVTRDARREQKGATVARRFCW